MAKIISAVVLFALLGPGVAFADTQMVGVNKYELLKQYIGRASGGDGSEKYLNVEKAMAKKALVDASKVGVTFVRIAAAGYEPIAQGRHSDLELWISDPKKYWQEVDAMFDDLDSANLQVVPNFVFNPTQFPAINGETVADLIGNPKSRSYQMALKYINEFVYHYKSRKTILFYEVSNELNLQVDMDNVGNCTKKPDRQHGPQFCSVLGNYTTAQMIAFTRGLAASIKKQDPSRSISSGYSIPRPSAEHLRAKPEWEANGKSSSWDSADEFKKNIKDIHEGVDIISVHLYPLQNNGRFGNKDARDPKILDTVVDAAKAAGKPLFLGEYGDSGRVDGRADSYSVRMMDRISALKVPYSAIWTWELYQQGLYYAKTDTDTEYSLEPGLTDDLIQHLHDLAAKQGQAQAHPMAAKGSKSSDQPPQVVLTWPLACAKLAGSQDLHAVASSDSKLKTVQFLVDDKVVGESITPPYTAKIDADQVSPGKHVLTARAIDAENHAANFNSNVIFGKDGDADCAK